MSRPRSILVIPAFGEAQCLPRVLADIAEARLDFEVVVIDDGSADETGACAGAFGATLIRHPFNMGYGAALQTGYKYALQRGARLLVQMDADGQHDPREVSKLIEPILRGDADLVVGSRFLGATAYLQGMSRRLGRYAFAALAKVFGLAVTDPTSGFQAMNRKVLELYAADFYPTDYPDVDVLLTAHRHGVRIRECPVTMSAGWRASSLHGGSLRAVYYAYKMLLSVWAASAARADRVDMRGGIR